MTAPALVDCARAALRLTDTACAKFWLLSNPIAPPAWQGRHHCHGCTAGAARAGATVDHWQPVRERLAPICSRCRRSGLRMIGKTLCVCCYNRNREIRCGRNGKGGAPRFVAARLHAARLVAIEAGRVERIERDIAAGVLELVIDRGRRAKSPLAFGWAPPPLQESAA